MRRLSSARAAALLGGFLAFGLGLVSCTDAEENPSSIAPGGGGAPVDPIAPSAAGSSGCSGADQAFLACAEVDLTAALTSLNPAVGSLTAVTGAFSSPDLLFATAVYATSNDSTVVEIDLTDPMNPAVRDLLPVGALDTLVSGLLGANSQGELAGLAVLDGSTIVAVELATNTLVAVGRQAPGSLRRFAGAPAATGGFFDGEPSSAMFALDAESGLVPTADGRLFVADTGNSALRVVLGNPLFEPSAFVATLVGGTGAGFADGSLQTAMLDAPTSIVASCADRLLLAERGDGGNGHRVRSVTLGGLDPFQGTFLGSVGTLLGDGVAESLEGTGVAARVAAPLGLQTSTGGEAYWIDAGTGTLRRLTGVGEADCPLGPCNVASMACSALSTDFTPAATFTTAVSAAGQLFVLESGTTLLRQF